MTAGDVLQGSGPRQQVVVSVDVRAGIRGQAEAGDGEDRAAGQCCSVSLRFLFACVIFILSHRTRAWCESRTVILAY